LTLTFSKLGPIRLAEPVTLELDRAILYGRNAQGKSTIIKTLLLLLVKDEAHRGILVPEVEEDRFWLQNLLSEGKVELCMGDRCVDRPGLLDDVKAARIVGDVLYIIARTRENKLLANRLNIQNIDHLEAMLSEPEVVEALEEFFEWLDPPVEFYRGFFKEPINSWLKIAHLAYGYRRALMILYAIEKCDVVSIEGFESGLHIDLMKLILQHINEKYRDKKVVVIETHSGLPVTYGLATGWTIYYVTRNNIVRLQSYRDLIEKAELFLKELEAVKFEVPP
jgi:energy-coupling factor transporter ATP-binding protein EcfA2